MTAETENAAPAVLAIDGGASKTDALLVSADGHVLGRARVGPSSHQYVGIDAAVEALDESIASAFRQAGLSLSEPPYVPVGVYCLAGIDLPVDEEQMAPAIALRNWSLTDILRNDTFAVCRAGTTQSWGIGVVCGSGLNCAGIGPDGTVVRFPALHELSGDFAPGGSWLGVRALGLALRAADGRGPATMLSARVPEHFDRPTAADVLTAVYTGDIEERRLLELAPVLLDAARDGDGPARQAADFLADEVVAFSTAAITRLHLAAEAVEVVLGGGIFDTDDRGFHDRVRHGILAVAPKADLRYLDVPPVLGAGLLGLDALGEDERAHDTLRAELRATEIGNQQT